MDKEAWQRKKEHLTRSMFHDLPVLSAIREDSDEFTGAASSFLCSPPEPHQSYASPTPQAHGGGIWDPLPPLTIEIVKKINKHDEPEEYYKRLERKILKIYRRIFFEDRSDISDIVTSDVDDISTNNEPIGHSTYNIEFFEPPRDTPINEPIDLSTNSIKFVKSVHDTSNNNEPMDLSTNRLQLVESTRESILNDTEADQENENVTRTDTENQQSNEVTELRSNQSTDENHNESDDENSNDNDDDSFFPNLKNNVESNESDSHNSKTKILSDDNRVSSSTDVMANSTETDGGDRNSVTPSSSTVVLSDEELCFERNEVPADTTHHMEPEAVETEGIRTSGPRPPTTSTPRAEANSTEDNDDIENKAIEADISPFPANNDLQMRTEAAEIEGSKTSGPRSSTASTPRAEANPTEDNDDIENKAIEADISPFPANNDLQMRTEAAEIEGSKTSGPRSSTASTPKAEANLTEDNDDMENVATEEDNINEESDNTETSEAREGSPSEDMGDDASMDTDPDNNTVQSQVEEMRTPRPHHSIGSPTHRPIQPYEPNVVIIEHHASMESETYSNNEENEIHASKNNTNISGNIELFDLIRMSSPKDIIPEDNTKITNPEEYVRNISRENNSDINRISGNNLEEILSRDSLQENNKKRKSSPCRCMDKRVRLVDKNMQTDYSNKYIYKYKYVYRYKYRYKNNLQN